MPFTTLISTATLSKHLNEPAWVVIDCRFKLDDVEWGEREYATAHIPGAIYAHLDRDLSAAKTGRNGRHPLPEPAALTATFSRFGIGDNTQVVAYDQDSGMYASRLWWMLRYMGHDAVAVLDGGFARWTADARETRAGAEARTPASFTGQARREMVVDATAIAAIVDSDARSTTLLDARAPQRFRGETEPLDRVAGHIPGAANYFFQQNLDASGTFRTPEELRAQFGTVIGGRSARDVVCYCGSGVTACHNLLALEHAGLKGARLYPGSWSEWCADEHHPVATGAKG